LWILRVVEVGAGDEGTLMETAEVRGGRVLVVDDDPDVREAVETALELEGHRVMTAADGLRRVLAVLAYLQGSEPPS
jgi:CheY-like chemotaxis protein